MYESIEQKELYDYLSNPEVRHLYIDSSIRHLLAMQLRSMREARELSQIDVGNNADMKQSAIARLEDPTYSSMTLSTLKRLAKAFDVALIVRFAPFSEFISWTAQIDEPQLSPPSFKEEEPPRTIEEIINIFLSTEDPLPYENISEKKNEKQDNKQELERVTA